MTQQKDHIAARVAPELAEYLDGLANGSTRSAVIERIVRERRAAASEEAVAEGAVAAADFARVLRAIPAADHGVVVPGVPRPSFARWLTAEGGRLGVDVEGRDATDEEIAQVRAEIRGAPLPYPGR
jgi:hypothetical protein